ncbi:SusD/RagB family nutrient-binding outer membrane lipoprotein [Chitinophaga caseinilytica]|uniref:SusD/RagB family nutrient-binding outer membrane lipoprotein n=1 Tax=Chitinophaga caseinilytica TaxID=2267521 RepID=A0ABZ2Z6S8_9BACT
MKAMHKFGMGALALATFASACTRDFAEMNTSPEISKDMKPEQLITLTQKTMVDRDFEWFYDNYSYIMPWMQFTVSYPNGNPASIFNLVSNVNGFYSAFYNDFGRNLADIQRQVNAMAGEERARYAHIAAIATVHKVWGAWRTTDVNGSIPYSEAMGARTDQNFTPKYDNQAALYAQFDAELKGAIAALTTPAAGQISFGNADVFYGGDAAKWAKAANVLRLKIAMRLLERDQQKTRQIVAEVLASPAGLFAGNAEEWKFISGNQNFARGGNWNAQGFATRGGQAVVNYLYDNADPRLALFFKKNAFTQSVFNRLKAGGAFPASATWNPRQYVGVPASPDASKLPANAKLFGVKSYQITENGASLTVNYDTLSTYQNRLFDLGSDGAGDGRYTQPIASYAEMCFLISELSVRGISTEDAQAWYVKGVKASIRAYEQMGKDANIVEFAAINEADIDAYLAKPNVAFTGTTEVLLEKIGIQQYLNHFKQPWEAWGSWKRLGYPKVGGILNREAFVADGTTRETPRRWALPVPQTLNRPNYNAAVQEMIAGGEYGTAVEEITGRVWWDKK